jgi:hypothetical protein
MRTATVAILTLLATAACLCSEFTRNLPDDEILKQITPEKFKNVDALIILKEQALNIQYSTIYYRNVPLYGPTTTRVRIIIAKLLNEEAVNRYGSFEYTYREFFGNEIPNGFKVVARVKKPDGSIWVLPEKEVRNIVATEDADGSPLTRKVLFKIPNLAPGDVVQIEQAFTEAFSRSSSGIFFYNDRDPIMFSNLSITLPADDDARYYSFTEDRVGKPTVSQISKSYGSGETYFWSVKNLNAIPRESYSRTFADQSLMTAFIVDDREKSGMRAVTDWNRLGRKFYERYVDKDDVKESRLKELGIPVSRDPVSIEAADSLYTLLRKSFTLETPNSLYPRSSDLDAVFKRKKGDASDIAYIMYRILRRWKQDASVVWIRDKRDGIYEVQVPTTSWFDRIGVLLTVAGEERLYDFDRCVPTQYEAPSFLRTAKVVVVSDRGAMHKQFNIPSPAANRYAMEKHWITFDEGMQMRDSMIYACRGSFAESYREKFYAMDQEDIHKEIKALAASHCFSEPDLVDHNEFIDEPEVRFSLAGPSRSAPEQIESFLTFKLQNHILQSFYERIYSASRHNDVMLPETFNLTMEWEIAIPAGYDVHSMVEAASYIASRRISGSVNSAREGNIVTIKAVVKFGEAFIPFANYGEMIKLLQKVSQAIEKEIVLRKL